MTSPAGPPERGARDGAATGPDDPATQDPSELADAIRTGRVPVVPGSLVELVMRSGITPDDAPDTADGDPRIAAPAPVSPGRDDRSEPTGAAGREDATAVVEPLEDVDLGDLGDDPLGVGPLRTGASESHRTGDPGANDDDTPDATPPTAPGDVVPAPISPTPAPVPEPETGPNREAARGSGAHEPEPASAEPDDPGVAEPDPMRWPLFGGRRPPSDGPATDVLPGMAFGRVAGRYPSADPVSSTGRTTMPGRRRPDPAPEPGPPPTTRPTMPDPLGSRPPAAEQPPTTAPPPLSAPPPSLAPEPPAPGPVSEGPGGAGNGPSGFRPVADRRRPERDDRVSATATTNIIPAVPDELPPGRVADGPPETGAGDPTRTRDGRTGIAGPPGSSGREGDPWDPAPPNGVAPDPGPASPRRNGHVRAPHAAAGARATDPATRPPDPSPAPSPWVREDRPEPDLDDTGDIVAVDRDGPGPAVAEAPANGAETAGTAEDAGDAAPEAVAEQAPAAKKTTPPREAIMSAGPRNGRGVSAGGLAIALAAILLAILTIWAIIQPSTPDTTSNGAGPQAVSPAAAELRPAPVQAAASRPDPSGRATVPVTEAPQDVAVSPGGRFAYVAVQEPPRLVVLDAGTDVVTAEIPLPGPPRFVGMAPDGARAYVSMSDQDNAVNLLGVVDVVGNRLASTIPVGADPARAVPSPDGRFVYLASRGEARIDEIDPNAGVVTRSVPVARDPFAVAPTPDGDRLIAANRGSGQMTVLDPNTLSVLANHPVSGDAQAVAVSPTAPQVAVAGPDTDLVTIVDPGSGREIATVRVRTGPTALAFAPDGRHLYVAAGDAVRVVDTASWEDVGTVPTGPGASSIAVSPDGRTAWVTNGQAGSVSVLNLA